MKFKTAILFLFFLTACVSTSKNHYFITKPYLFEAKKGSKTIYLFGTIHYGVFAEDLPEWFWPVFNSADAYAYESTGLSDKSEFKSWLKKRFYRDPKQPSLKQLLTPLQYEKLDFYLPNLKNKDKDLHDKSVFFVLMFIFRKDFHEAFGDALVKKSSTDKAGRMNWTDKNIDYELFKRSEALKKENFSLDQRTEEDFKCAYETDEVKILNAIKYRLDRPPSIPDKSTEVDQMLHDYRSGEVKYKKSTESKTSIFNTSCYITGRNRLWIPRIFKILEKYDKLFIAVGSSHIFKDNPNLLQLLQNEGFSVSRLEK